MQVDNATLWQQPLSLFHKMPECWKIGSVSVRLRVRVRCRIRVSKEVHI